MYVIVLLATEATVVEAGDVSESTYEEMPLSLSVQFTTIDEEAIEAAGTVRTGFDGARVFIVVVAVYAL